MNIGAGFRRCLRPLAQLAAARGITLYAVGGCVRDGLRGAPVRDIDLVVENDARALARACVRRAGGSCEIFDRFGTVRLLLKGGYRVDIARARTEVYPAPAQLPVVRPASLAEDLRRRDFTVNAMARSLTERGAGQLIDPYGGASDLRARRLRTLHPASFRDDPTRIFRAARYAGRLGFAIERGTCERLAAAVHQGLPRRLSRERVRQELVRILEERAPAPAMRRLRVWNMLPVLHPRFRWPRKAQAPASAHVRLGLCACALSRQDGREFLRSLPLARAVQAALALAVDLRHARRTPREAPPPLALGVLRAQFPDLPASAFGPLFVGGADLRRAGLAPGEAYARWLERAARRQWRGADRRRFEARAWLKESLKP
ncbi:MAG: hypothetical protein ABIJ96_14100 [Elusimicrobiota bacterium]